MKIETEYYCHSCRENRITYCGTNIKIGLDPSKTWPNDKTPCTLQQEQKRKDK